MVARRRLKRVKPSGDRVDVVRVKRVDVPNKKFLVTLVKDGFRLIMSFTESRSSRTLVGS